MLTSLFESSIFPVSYYSSQNVDRHRLNCADVRDNNRAYVVFAGTICVQWSTQLNSVLNACICDAMNDAHFGIQTLRLRRDKYPRPRLPFKLFKVYPATPLPRGLPMPQPSPLSLRSSCFCGVFILDTTLSVGRP